ncbi:MAG: acyltransferase [Muribaculaceae bacterium]|nr:acyltransferase [Muribaculaceae bacterium]
MASLQKQYYPNLDILKGLCMLLVIIDHCTIGLHPTLDHIEVPIFFIISGFLYRPEQFISMIRKKTERLIVPYLFFCTLYYIPTLINYFTHGQHTFNIVNDVILFYFLPANSPLWFLKTLFWLFILYHTISWISAHYSKQKYSIISLAIAITISLTYYHLNNIIPCKELLLMSGLPQAIMSLPLFALGTALHLHTSKIDRYNTPTIFIIAISCIALWIVCARDAILLYSAQFNQYPLLSYICSTTAFIALFLITKHIKSIPILSYLGKNSIIVFGIHLVIISTLKSMEIDSSSAKLLLTITISLPLTFLLNKYVPRLCGSRPISSQ